MSFTIATSTEEALEALAHGAAPIAGGTDLVVGARHGKFALPPDLVAIDRIEALATIEKGADSTRIGSGVTHAQLLTDPTIVGDYTALADAAALVGSPATRNVGTIGGNIMNASPAMDTGAPLTVFAAMVELARVGSKREFPISELWAGPGRTTAASDELCTTITLPSRPLASGSAYVRLEYRRAMEIAVVGAAASVELANDGSISAVAVALTAVAPTIISLDLSGTDLLGTDLVGPDACGVGRSGLASVAAAASDQCSPIGDLRASDRYRRHCVGVMASRAVEAAARRAAGEVIAVPVNRALGIGASS